MNLNIRGTGASRRRAEAKVIIAGAGLLPRADEQSCAPTSFAPTASGFGPRSTLDIAVVVYNKLS